MIEQTGLAWEAVLFLSGVPIARLWPTTPDWWIIALPSTFRSRP
jgi:hypothetical protein